MPSPFPGMDPYLEHPVYFPGLDDSMVTYLREALQPALPPPYYAEIGDRVWVEVSERPIGPDVKVLRQENGGETPGERSPNGGIATAVRAVPMVVTVPHDELREPFLAIYARGERERLVTSIEVLSLANKTPGAHGRDLYLRKQREILGSQTNLVEIDLLRAGEHTTAVLHDRAVAKTGPFDYHVCIHRFDRLEDYLVYPTFADETAGRSSRRYYVVAVDALGQEGFPSSPVWFQREWREFYKPFVGDWHQ